MPHATGTNGFGIETRTRAVANAGHAFFAVTMVALGILGLIQGDFTPTWSGLPKSVPAREAVAYLCAVISLGSGIGLLWPRAAKCSRLPRAAWLFLDLAGAREATPRLSCSDRDGCLVGIG